MPCESLVGRKSASSTRTPATSTEVLYVRIPSATADRIRAHAKKLGWPHTFASVAAEAIERGLEKESR